MESYSVLGVQVDICFRVKCTEAELIKNHSGALGFWLFFWSVSFLFFVSHYILIDLNTHGSLPNFC